MKLNEDKASTEKAEISVSTLVNEKATKWMEKNRSMSLRQTPIWAQSLAASLALLGTIAISAGFFYRIDEVVNVSGQLKTIGGTFDVKSPVGGIIEKVYFKDGELVKKGQLLLSFDTAKAKADIATLEKLIDSEKISHNNRLLLFKGQKDIQLKKKNITEQKLKTKTTIFDNLSELEKQGGVQKIQILNYQDEILALAEELSIIDDQLNQIELSADQSKVEHEKQIEQFTNSLKNSKLQLKYQNIVSPVDGIVFDQKASPSNVFASGDKLLSVVSQEGLYAEIFIDNRNIGFINIGQKADVRVDAFPFTQFGSLKGSITHVGADALEPTPTVNYYSFPAKISLEKNYLVKNNKRINLKPGMSVTSNLQLGDKPLISLVSDIFVKQVDSLKEIRQSDPQ